MTENAGEYQPIAPVETTVARFVGGPADGQEFELHDGIDRVQVPILGRDIDRYVPRGNYPRRKPRGVWTIVYTVDPNDRTRLLCL